MQSISYLRSTLLLLALAASPFAQGASRTAGAVDDARVSSESTGDNWLVKGGSFAQQQFSPLRDINDRNVAGLGFAWATEIDEPMGLTAEPLVVDGVIYLSAPRSRVHAIDARTGKVLWSFDPHVQLDGGLEVSYAARVNRGVAVWEGRVYVGTGDGRLVAIDAADDEGTIRAVASMGFGLVEPAGYPGSTPEKAAKLFKELGL